ncbi:hypothetical protein [Modestobacter roseus]|uniref:hypothetical protein n=1 Tax=Modestobacter roseus TaxID=1181884 RepID=UPI0034E01D3A
MLQFSALALYLVLLAGFFFLLYSVVNRAVLNALRTHHGEVRAEEERSPGPSGPDRGNPLGGRSSGAYRRRPAVSRRPTGTRGGRVRSVAAGSEVAVLACPTARRTRVRRP